MITKTEPTIDDILDVLAESRTALPRDALHQAIERWPEFSEVILAMLDEIVAGAEITDALGEIMFFAIFLMAQQRDTRAYGPLCAIGLQGDRMALLIGDAVTEFLPHIFARVYNGDTAPLEHLMGCAEADEFNRSSAFEAFAWLAATGRIDRDHAEAALRAHFETMLPRSVSFVWYGWLEAVSLLGLDQLSPLVKEVFSRGWVDDTIMMYEDFEVDLQGAGGLEDPSERVQAFSTTLDRFDDVADFLSKWPYFTDMPQRPRAYSEAVPVRNPMRKVGRNDPCPCGSGKKYKKCCLA
jgi:hypothetical protein